MISKDKQYKTREGLEVRIYATDGMDNYPIHGAVLTDNGWTNTVWSQKGNFNSLVETRLDLIEIVPKVKVWVEYYLSESGNLSTSLYQNEEKYLRLKAGGGQYPNLTHLKVDVFEYEPKLETK
jgi:hypothetical protein